MVWLLRKCVKCGKYTLQKPFALTVAEAFTFLIQPSFLQLINTSSTE